MREHDIDGVPCKKRITSTLCLNTTPDTKSLSWYNLLLLAVTTFPNSWLCY